MTYADRDGASRRTMQRRREADIAFLAKLRAATIEELEVERANHAHKRAPLWKKVAVARAIRRVLASAP